MGGWKLLIWHQVQFLSSPKAPRSPHILPSAITVHKLLCKWIRLETAIPTFVLTSWMNVCYPRKHPNLFFFWSLDKLSSQTAKSSLNDFVTASLNLFVSFSSLIKKTGITLLHCKTKETSMTWSGSLFFPSGVSHKRTFSNCHVTIKGPLTLGESFRAENRGQFKYFISCWKLSQWPSLLLCWCPWSQFSCVMWPAECSLCHMDGLNFIFTAQQALWEDWTHPRLISLQQVRKGEKNKTGGFIFVLVQQKIKFTIWQLPTTRQTEWGRCSPS